MVGSTIQINGFLLRIESVFLVENEILAISVSSLSSNLLDIPWNRGIIIPDLDLNNVDNERLLSLFSGFGGSRIYRFRFIINLPLKLNIINNLVEIRSNFSEITHQIYQTNHLKFNRLVSILMQDEVNTKIDEYKCEPYKINCLVYHKIGNSRLFDATSAGKIINYVGLRNGCHRYTVHFLSEGTNQYYHHDIIPAESSFDTLFESNGYISNVNCSELFNEEDKFIEINGYLYNKSHSVILHLESQKNNFTKFINKNDIIKTPISKIPSKKSAPDILGF